jgi:acetoacetyl-CoA reductase
MKALVTGASKGIGLEISKTLTAAGYQVFGLCRNIDDNIISNWHSITGTTETLFQVDISERDKTESFFNQFVTKEHKIDVLVNNAGITSDAMFKKMTYEDWSTVIDTNLKSIFNVTNPIYKTMLEHNFGRIINISSVNGQKGQAGQTNYSASKAGIHGFTKALSLEGARHNVTVNTIAPGYIETRMLSSLREDIKENIKMSIPMKRFGRPEDVAALVKFLVSDSAAYITGAEIPINGGLFIS